MVENKVLEYLGYRAVWWDALLKGDFETEACYRDEMTKLIHSMNTDEVLETIRNTDILDKVYSSYARQR